MVRKTHSFNKKIKNQKGGADLIDITKLANASYIKRLDSANFDVLSMVAPSGNRATYEAELLGLENSSGAVHFPDIKNTSNELNSGELLEIDELIKISNESEKAKTTIAEYLKEIQSTKFPNSGDYSKVNITNIGFKADGVAKEQSLLKKGIENMIALNVARGEYDIDCVAEVLKKKPEQMWGSLESVLGWKYVNLQAYAFFSPRQLAHLLAYSLDHSGSSASYFSRDHLDFLKQNFAIYDLTDAEIKRLYSGAKLDKDESLEVFAGKDEVKDKDGSSVIEKMKDPSSKTLSQIYEIIYKLNTNGIKKEDPIVLLQFLQAIFLFSVFKFLGPLRDEIIKKTKKNEKLEYRTTILLKQIDAYVKFYSWILASLFELDEGKTSILKKVGLSDAEWKNVAEKMAEEFPVKINTDKKLNVEETAKAFYKLFIKYQPKSMPFFGASLDNEVAKCTMKFIKNYYSEMKSLYEKVAKRSSKVREELGKKIPREEAIKIRDLITTNLDKIATNPYEEQRLIQLQALINTLTKQFGLLRLEFHKLIRLNLLDASHVSKSGIKEYTKEQQEKEIKQNQVNLRSEALIAMAINLYKDYMGRYNKDGKVIFPEEFNPVLLRSFGNEDVNMQRKVLEMFKEKIANRENKDALATTVLRPINVSSLIKKNASNTEELGKFKTLQTLMKTVPTSASASGPSGSSAPGPHAALSKPVSASAPATGSTSTASKLEELAKVIVKADFWQACYNKLEKKLFLPFYYNGQVGVLDVFKVAIDGKISSDPFPLSSSDYVYYFPLSSSERGLKRTEELIRNKGIVMITDKMGDIGNMKNWFALNAKVYRESILKNKKNPNLLRAHLFNILVNANTYREEVGKPIGDSKISLLWAKYCKEYGAPLENCNILLAREPIMAYLGVINKVDMKVSNTLIPYRVVSTLS